MTQTAATSPQTSAAKSITVTCPAGKRVTSAGVDATPGNGHVLIDDLRPNAELTSVTATVLADATGIAGDWSAQALAICVSR